jgi:hypothetical protein
MTEEQWLRSGDPWEMLRHLRSVEAAERKARLFICACWRPRVHLVTGPAELLAEIEAVEGDRYHGLPQWYFPTYRDFWYAALISSNVHLQFTTKTPPELGLSAAQQVAVIRDLFGNPFRTVSCSPEWRTDTAVSLARQMYEARDFSAMPILADALQDAGCENEDVLNHCRDTNQPHVRGCWVVDLVLGKG